MLQMKTPIIDVGMIEKMFGSVKPILDRHKIFEMALDTTIMEWDVKQRIGDIFTASFETQIILESYSDFINSLPEVLKLIQKLCGRKSFLEFCTKQQEKQGIYNEVIFSTFRFFQIFLLNFF